MLYHMPAVKRGFSSAYKYRGGHDRAHHRQPLHAALSRRAAAAAAAAAAGRTSGGGCAGEEYGVCV